MLAGIIIGFARMGSDSEFRDACGWCGYLDDALACPLIGCWWRVLLLTFNLWKRHAQLGSQEAAVEATKARITSRAETFTEYQAM